VSSDARTTAPTPSGRAAITVPCVRVADTPISGMTLGMVVAVIHDNNAYPRRCKAGRTRTLALSPRCDDVTAVAVWALVPPAIGLSSVHRWCPTQHM
jgi:hypothetical protein